MTTAIGEVRSAVREGVRDARRAWDARAWLSVAAFALLASVPAIVSDPVTVSRMASGLYIALAAVGLNFAVGLAGMPSLGQGAFAGAGAFTTAWLRTHAGWEPAPAVLAGVALAVAAGLAVGIGAVRLRGVFVAVSTWIVAWMLAFVLSAFPGLSGGSQGLVLPVPRVGIPGTGIAAHLTEGVHFELALVLLGLALLAFLAISRGGPGLALAAVRQSPAQAAALGVDGPRLQLGAFVAAAGIAGLAGSLSVQLAGVADPAGYGPLLSVELFVAVLLGGEGRVLGPVLGAGLLVLIPGAARGLGSFAGVGLARFEPVLASAFLLTALLLGRGGLLRVLERGIRWLRPPQEANAPPAESGGALPTSGGRSLNATGIVKRFGGVVALDGVDVEVSSGEVHALIGPNGSGKTTLLRLLGGTMRPDAGGVALGGRDVTGRPTTELAQQGMVRTLQRTAVFPELTALDHVTAGATVRRRFDGPVRTLFATPRARREAARLREDARAILAAAGLEDQAFAPVERIPVGSQRMLMLCTAYAALPGVLLLDEPSAGMEAGETRLVRFLRALAQGGVAVLLVEHDFHLVRAVADRVTVLDAGRVIASGSPRQVAGDPNVQRAYLGADRKGLY